MRLESRLTRPSITPAASEESLPRPMLSKRTGRLSISLKGFSTAWAFILSSSRHCSSASTSAPGPRARRSESLASPTLPRTNRLLVVSGTSSVAVILINAGTVPRPSESLQPQPWILAPP
ncbi:hypothetical protein EJ110_NYTH01855 [Nymphaea thermarum]|nr:hypothetical protein EJ110_NYTH01855 [Nymphaea thermarum]